MNSSSSPPWAPDVGRALGAAVTGADGHVVQVRARIRNGLDAFSIDGLPDMAAATTRDRIRAAVINSGQRWPFRAITVSVAPAHLAARSGGLDLAIAVAVLTASGTIPAGAAARRVLIAELGLDGRLRTVRGILPAVTAAAEAGCLTAILAPGNAAEAAPVLGVGIVSRPSLGATVAWLKANPAPPHVVWCRMYGR